MKKLIFIFAFLSVLIYVQAQESLKLTVCPEKPLKEYRLCASIVFATYLHNISDKPVKVIDPFKVDAFWGTYKSANTVTVNGIHKESFWFIERPDSRFSKKAVTTLMPKDSMVVYYFRVEIEDTSTYIISAVHEQLRENFDSEVIEALGKDINEMSFFKLSSEPFIIKPAYPKVTKDNLTISYEDLAAPPKKSEVNPMMYISNYPTYNIKRALGLDDADEVYKITFNKGDAYLARNLPLLKNVRWIELTLDWNDSIFPPEIGQMDKVVFLKINGFSQKENFKKLDINAIKNLKELRVLEISNTYNDKLPEWFSNFTELKRLCLFSAFFDYSGLGYLSNSKLEDLEINGTLNQYLPEEIKKLSKLKRLLLYKFSSGTKEPVFSEIPDLSELILRQFQTDTPDLNGCKAKNIEISMDIEADKYPKGLSILKQVETLVMSVKCDDEFPDMSECRSLKRLRLTNNMMTRPPENILKIVNLKDLSLYVKDREYVITSLLKSIGNLENLENLSLTHINLTTIPDEIGLLKNLKRLLINNNQLKTLPETLFKLTPHLEILDVTKNPLDKATIKKLQDITTIKDLRF